MCVCICESVCLCVTHPVAIVMDVDGEVQVHGAEGGAVLELLRRQPLVDHVVVERVEQLDVHVAHQSVQDLLQQPEEQHTFITATGVYSGALRVETDTHTRTHTHSHTHTHACTHTH